MTVRNHLLASKRTSAHSSLKESKVSGKGIYKPRGEDPHRRAKDFPLRICQACQDACDYFIHSCLNLHFFVVDPKHSIYGVFTSLLHKIENIRAGIKNHLHFHFECDLGKQFKAQRQKS